MIRTAEVDPATGTLSAEAVISLITPQTRLIAVTLASNITGSMVDVASISDAAHSVGAAVYVDANHAAAHTPLDVQALGCDFLTFAPYKCFGPHLGVLWGKRELLERLAPNQLPSTLQTLPEPLGTGRLKSSGVGGSSGNGALCQQYRGAGTLVRKSFAVSRRFCAADGSFARRNASHSSV